MLGQCRRKFHFPQKCCGQLYRKNNRLANIRLATVALQDFLGMMNWLISDHVLSHDGVTIRIPRSKTDQYRQGNEVVIARTTSDTCPVAMLEEYIRRAEIDLRSQLFLYCPITGSSRPLDLYAVEGAKLEELGYPSADFGVHSLRAGGATATAAAASGMPDRLFKKHGRWRSESAKDGYIVNPLDQRLLFTRQFGL